MAINKYTQYIESPHVPTYAPLPFDELRDSALRFSESQALGERGAHEYTTQNLLADGLAGQVDRRLPFDIDARVKQEFDFIDEIAAGGDYRGVTRTLAHRAREFQRELTPHIQRSKAIQGFEQALSEREDSLMIKNWARQQAGLATDPETGKFVGDFSPFELADYVDIPAFVDEYSKNMPTQQQISDLHSSYGGQMISRYTTEFRSGDRVEAAVAARLLNDAKMVEYMAMEVAASGTDASSPEAFQKVLVEQALLHAKAPSIREEFTKVSGSDRMDSFALKAYGHRLDNMEPEHKLSIPMHFNVGATEWSTPQGMSNVLEDMETGITETRRMLIDSLNELGISHKPNTDGTIDVDIKGGAAVVNGQDYSSQIEASLAHLTGMRDQLHALNEKDQKLRKEAGLKSLDLTPDQIAEERRKAEIDVRKQAHGRAFGLADATEVSDPAEWERRINAQLEQNLMTSPSYKRYIQLLEREGAAGTIITNVRRFASKDANDFMEKLPLKAAPTATWTWSTSPDTPLTNKERNNLDFSKFVWVGTKSVGNKDIAVYTASDSKGDLITDRHIYIDAANGTYEAMMQQAGISRDDKRMVINSQLRQLEAGANSIRAGFSQDISLPVDADMHLPPEDRRKVVARVVVQSDEERRRNLGAPYRIEFRQRDENGEVVTAKVPAMSSQDVGNKFIDYYIRTINSK